MAPCTAAHTSAGSRRHGGSMLPAAVLPEDPGAAASPAAPAAACRQQQAAPPKARSPPSGAAALCTSEMECLPVQISGSGSAAKQGESVGTTAEKAATGGSSHGCSQQEHARRVRIIPASGPTSGIATRSSNAGQRKASMSKELVANAAVSGDVGAAASVLAAAKLGLVEQLNAALATPGCSPVTVANMRDAGA